MRCSNTAFATDLEEEAVVCSPDFMRQTFSNWNVVRTPKRNDHFVRTSFALSMNPENFLDLSDDAQRMSGVNLQSGFGTVVPIPALSRWPRQCAEMFDDLAEHNPDELIRMIVAQEIEHALLTFAAESLGRTKAAQAIPTLLRLLKHEWPPVREGAIYGLEHHLRAGRTNGLVKVLRDISENDPSKGVQAAARDALSSLD